MIAHKFGGSSVADAACMQHVVDVLLARDEQQVIVVSAMKGVTDALIGLVQQAAARDQGWREAAAALSARHATAALALLPDEAQPLLDWLTGQFGNLHDLLHAQALVGAASPDLLAFVSGLGEIWSSRLLAAALRRRHREPIDDAVGWLDARDVLVVEHTDLGARVDWRESQERLAQFLPARPPRLVVPGFVARTPDGRVTTLGRNGSDHSGAIFAALLGAAELHVWSDVDGVLSADPRLVPEAVHIPHLSYSEACELAYFGAKVLHPQTMAPAIARDIPLIARNTFRPELAGTRIDAWGDLQQPVKGITTFRGLALLNLEGAGMIGVPGTAERVFAALHRARVSVVMISQGSSEHSICCVLRAEDATRARDAVDREFARELADGQVTAVSIAHDIAALAVVGDGMAGTPGVAARLFRALGRANVNVKLIAQGSSERNISVAVAGADAQRALRAVHAGFYLSAQTLSIGVIGPGNVGGAFLRQLLAARARLLTDRRLDLRVRAVASSRRMGLFDPMLHGEPALDRELDLEVFTRHVHDEHLPHAVVVDCSASDGIADRYRDWLAAGIHVLTPNKHAGSGPIERYRSLRSLPGQWHYEATVGAGLPIITTLRDLLGTGDRVLAIDGILSGTLAYLFWRFDGSLPFSALVREAMAKGFTEPDPRDDLSGRDVARKLVILARENGWSVNLDDVALESLVPPQLRNVDNAAFLQRLAELDAPLRDRLAAAQQEGLVLRYVARLTADGPPAVGLTAVPRDHALATILPTDNVVQFTTERYRDNPLVVRGPGAGPDVTAMGIFADLLRVAASLGAER